MDFLFLYTNLIRLVVVILTAVKLYKHKYKILTPAFLTLAISFIPWLLSLIHVRINPFTVFLFQTVVFAAVYLGIGYKFYNLFPWWDRSIHFVSGIVFFGFGVSLAQKAPDAGFAGTLVFSFALSMALHEIWEVSEFIFDSIFHSDNQHWQKNSPIKNHQPEKALQPPGLVDTMTDTISSIIGTTAACIGWGIYLSK